MCRCIATIDLTIVCFFKACFSGFILTAIIDHSFLAKALFASKGRLPS